MKHLSLQPGEKILWQGRPEPFRLLDNCQISHLLRDMLVSFVGGLLNVALFWLCSGREPVPPAVYSIVVLLVLLPPLRLVLDAIRLHHTEYLATDRRLLVIDRSTVRDVAYSRIRQAAFRRDTAGHTSLLCGEKALTGGSWSYRERTVVGLDALDGDDTVCDSFVFFAVAQPEPLRQVLKDRLPLQDAA